MRKTFLAAAMALAMTSALPALELNLHGGYTSFNLTNLNRANATLIGYEANPYSEPLNSGVLVGADALFSASEGLQFGVRAEMMQSNLAETKSNLSSAGSLDPDTCFTDQAGLSTLLVGVKATSSPVLKGLTLGLGAWAGYGYATLDQRQTLASINSVIQSGLFMGSLPVIELESSVNYGLGHGLSLSFTGGWRWANAGQLYDDTHNPLADNAQAWTYGGSSDFRGIDLDYSGITAQGSVSYSF